MAVTTSNPDVGATWDAKTSGASTISQPDVGAIQSGSGLGPPFPPGTVPIFFGVWGR